MTRQAKESTTQQQQEIMAEGKLLSKRRTFSLYEIFYLYFKNAASTFIKPFTLNTNGGESWGAGFVWLGHILLLPLTLTIIAGLKTAIDIFSRSPLEQTEEKHGIDMIQNMPNEKIDDLIEKVTQKYNDRSWFVSSSDSSKELMSALYPSHKAKENIVKQEASMLTSLKKEEKRNAFIHARNYQPEVINTVDDNFKVVKKLDYEVSVELTGEEIEEIQHEADDRASNWVVHQNNYNRELILNFVRNSINAGKFSQIAFFNEASSILKNAAKKDDFANDENETPTHITNIA